MLALYRSGRQAEALQVYERTRRLLAEELGLEPSETLQELQRRILRRDPELALTSPAQGRDGIVRAHRAPGPGRLLLALVATAGAVVLVVAFGFSRGGHGAQVVTDSLAVLDPATDRFVG